MAINHRVTSLVFAFAVGLSVSWCSYQWVTDSERGERRALEVAVVESSRQILRSYLVPGGGELELSDPLERVREAGKVYIYPTAGGWEISGQYQRPDDRRWHAYLMLLDADAALMTAVGRRSGRRSCGTSRIGPEVQRRRGPVIRLAVCRPVNPFAGKGIQTDIRPWP